MPLSKKWFDYKKDFVNLEPDALAVYELGNSATSEILYIGEGKLKTELISHLPDGTCPIDEANCYRFHLLSSKEKSIKVMRKELASYVEMKNTIPKFNQKFNKE